MSDVLQAIKANYNYCYYYITPFSRRRFEFMEVSAERHACLTHDRNSWRCQCSLIGYILYHIHAYISYDILTIYFLVART